MDSKNGIFITKMQLVHGALSEEFSSTVFCICLNILK